MSAPGVERRSVRSTAIASSVAVIASAVMLLWTAQAARALGMDQTLPANSYTRALMSLGVAISHLGHGATGYVLYSPVVHALIDGGLDAAGVQTPGRIDAAIKAAYDVPVPADCNTAGMCEDDWGDDKGYSDYVTVAFWLFGPHIASFYWLYFAILTISCAIYAAQFFTSPKYLLLLPMVLVAHYATVIVMPNSTVNSVLHDSRFLPALSLIAMLHIGVLLLREGPFQWSAVPGLLVQTLIIVFSINGRASGQWQIVFLGLMLVVGGWLAFRATGALLQRAIVTKVIAFAVVVLCVQSLGLYKQLTYDQRYLTRGIPSHVTWHNIYMGFGVHPDAVSRYDLNPTDATSYRHAERFMHAFPSVSQGYGFDPAVVPYPVFPTTGWRIYDEIMKAMYWQFWRSDPVYALATYLWYKPIYFTQQLGWQLGLTDTFPTWVAIDEVVLPAGKRRLDLLGAPALVGVLLPLLAGLWCLQRDAVRDWLVLVVGTFVTSLIPGMAVVPFYYELPVVFVTTSLLLYSVVAILIVTCWSWLRWPVARRAVTEG